MKQFKKVGRARVGRSVFDLSHERKLTCDMGQLIPVMCLEMVPGDVFSFGFEVVARFQPLVAPMLHPTKIYIHVYFCPTRIIDDNWEAFITGGQDGADASSCPIWDPTNTAQYSLWDYMTFPLGYDPPAHNSDNLPLDYPRRMYNKVFNDFYRDQDLQTEVALTNETILRRNWEKDYFTSARPFQQRGTSPALPIGGTTSAVWPAGGVVTAAGSGASIDALATAVNVGFLAENANHNASILQSLNNNTVSLAGATTADVTDIRLAVAIQKWQERNARCGVRYVEFLGAHFDVNPRDDRLQRPEYVGGIQMPMIISEVLQTSETNTTPQGTMAGHGLGADRKFAGKYRAQEFGFLMAIMSIMPKGGYEAAGFERQFTRQTRYDYPFPEFANLSEQAVELMEICAINTPAPVGRDNREIWGYQGRFDEMRVMHSKAVAGMRDWFNFYHMMRDLDPLAPPELNEDFITCNPTKRIFAVQDEPGVMVSVGNLIKAVRPIPSMSNPGLMDH